MEVEFDTTPVALDTRDYRLVAAGHIDGAVSFMCYDIKTTTDEPLLEMEQLRTKHHKAAVRNLKFSPESGESLITITKNKAICIWDVETGKKKRCFRTAHDHPLVSMFCLNDNQLCTGDEEGIIKIWDWRATPSCIFEFEDVHMDVVNDMTSNHEKKILVTVSGDGTVAGVDFRNKRVVSQSEEMPAEILSVTVACQGHRVLCGSGIDGYADIFNWGEFGMITERLNTGHQHSVDRLLTVDDDELVVASGSGLTGQVRLARLSPNTDLGIMGSHGDACGVEALVLSDDREYLISCGGDNKIKFWNLKNTLKQLNSQRFEITSSGKRVRKRQKTTDKTNDFFSDL